VAANTRAMIYSVSSILEMTSADRWRRLANSERDNAAWPQGRYSHHLPVCSHPSRRRGSKTSHRFTAAATLLPLTIANKWTPEILFCGGSRINDKQTAYSMSAETPASNICQRMALSRAGIKKGWLTERLPEARVMGEGRCSLWAARSADAGPAILTPDGKVLILNGARTGLAGCVHPFFVLLS
jgi:hypothetical protein